MARKKKEVLPEVKEVQEVAQEMMAPLPGEVEAPKAVKEVEAKEVKEVEAPKAKKWYGACRISGGLRVDILVDGRFVEALKDLRLKYRGSSNQRVIDVQDSLKTGKVVEII